MFINKARDCKNNICGHQIATIRRNIIPRMSQRAFADELQRHGLDIDKNAVQRIESRQRFVTDLELAVIASVLKVQIDTLISRELLPLEK